MERLDWPRTVVPMLANHAAKRTWETLTTVFRDSKVLQCPVERKGLGKMAAGTVGPEGREVPKILLSPLNQHLS